MSVRILDIQEITKPISSPIRNAYIDFTKMTTSLVAVVTDVVRDGKRVVGYGFNSNGRYGQGGLIRERFAARIKEAAPIMQSRRVWWTISIMVATPRPSSPMRLAQAPLNSTSLDALLRLPSFDFRRCS